MDKIELRLDKDQADLLIFALGYARKGHPPARFTEPLRALQVWIRGRRERRWGDEYAPELAGASNGNGKH